MPPTPEDLDAAKAQPHPDDVNVAQEIVGDHLESQVFGTVTGRLSSDRIARALSAARERGARDEREACAVIAGAYHPDVRLCCFEDPDGHQGKVSASEGIAAAIRARGTK